jgi:hypothetical protein
MHAPSPNLVVQYRKRVVLLSIAWGIALLLGLLGITFSPSGPSGFLSLPFLPWSMVRAVVQKGSIHWDTTKVFATILCGWAFYFVYGFAMLRAKRKVAFLVLYAALIVLLSFNVLCWVAVSNQAQTSPRHQPH